MLGRLRAAIDARRDGDFVILARTDARRLADIDEAISRPRRYVEVGADMIFVQEPESVEELKQITASIDAPLMVNPCEKGRTPFLPAAELEAIGFDLVIYPISASMATSYAVLEVFRELKRTETTEALARVYRPLKATI